MTIRLGVLKCPLAICRLEPDHGIPPWALRGGLVFGDEDRRRAFGCLPNRPGTRGRPVVERLAGHPGGWVDGPRRGRRAGASGLAGRGISLCAVSTFDTNDMLVREGQLVEAIEALADLGNEFVEQPARSTWQGGDAEQPEQGRQGPDEGRVLTAGFESGGDAVGRLKLGGDDDPGQGASMG